ncbi:CDP-glycerol glycerophosphotransferase family protein [Glutamicibacter arilaitensis]|uniref:CDP-glycerol glycerophosphotransferase family protein n=1 Tax=Glutamicibacter arilaitensis TaxID=256701 RepID=UPI003FCF6235
MSVEGYSHFSKLDGKRTILSLSVRQSTSTVTIAAQVFPDLTLDALWLRHHSEWLQVGSFTLKTNSKKPISEKNTYYAIVDLAQISEKIAEESKNHLRDNPASEDNIESGRYHFYIGASSSQRRAPKIAREIHIDGNTLHFRYPLGRARTTRISTLKQVDTRSGAVRAYVNSSGSLSVAINDLPTPHARVQNHGASIKSGIFAISGLVNSRHTTYSRGKIILLGRTTGFRATADANMQLRITSTRKHYGHRRYAFHADIDLRDYAENITDDIFDIYIEMESPNYDDPVRKRVGITRYLVRRKKTVDSFYSNASTINIVPYYTFKAKRPSFQVEVFNLEAFRFLSSLLSGKKNVELHAGNKPIWLLGEMPYKAQDNAFHLFRFLQENHPEIDSYYVIKEDSPERKNLAGYNNVVDYRSKQHIELAVTADKLICTHQPLQLYPTRDPRFAKLVSADHIFIQHGVVAAKWIGEYAGRYATDFHADLAIVSSEREKEFFKFDLGYKDNEIAITGLSRFDELFSSNAPSPEKKIFVMPTWRYWLQDPDTFENSDYFLNWMAFLTSERLRDFISEKNMEIVFCLHPNMQQYSDHFAQTGYRVVYQGDVEVQNLIQTSCMMITDYSSAALDFAFQHRPVAYFQFDAARFPEPHADVSRELPGPIVQSPDLLVDIIIHNSASDFTMGANYVERANRLIKYRDTFNRQRTVEAIRDFKKTNDRVRDFKKTDFWQTLQRSFRKHRMYFPVMRLIFRLFKLAPLNSKKIVFESSLAREFNGNPKAIYDELARRNDNRKKIIVCNKRVRHCDENTVVVKRNSISFFWHLATAKYWINDQNFADFITRRSNGIFIQTWHGTPLKKMLFDQENIVGRDPGYVKRVTKSSSQWNRLVSPNAHTTNSLRSAYRYDGPAFELGYPRNDILSNASADLVAAIKVRLGITPGKKIVLYAPTFRDNLPTTRGRFGFSWPFSPEEFSERFGDNVVLLIRTHTLVNTKVSIPSGLEDRIIDVTKYSDIQELYLISDILITDYSSVFFDYAILNRPIIFFAYDLDLYRDELRGFYLDYEAELPGPIVKDTAQLFDQIAAIFNDSDNISQPIPFHFHEKYTKLEDGGASGRVVDKLL